MEQARELTSFGQLLTKYMVRAGIESVAELAELVEERTGRSLDERAITAAMYDSSGEMLPPGALIGTDAVLALTSGEKARLAWEVMWGPVGYAWPGRG